MAKVHFSSIEDALVAIKNGEAVVVMDDESRENEGDIIIAAEHATTEQVIRASTQLC